VPICYYGKNGDPCSPKKYENIRAIHRKVEKIVKKGVPASSFYGSLNTKEGKQRILRTG